MLPITTRSHGRHHMDGLILRRRLAIRQRPSMQIGGRSAAFESSHDVLTDYGLKYRSIPVCPWNRTLLVTITILRSDECRKTPFAATSAGNMHPSPRQVWGERRRFMEAERAQFGMPTSYRHVEELLDERGLSS